MECRIQLHNQEQQSFDWCKLDNASGEIKSSGTSELSALSRLCEDCTKTIVFISQQNILLTSPVLPPKASKQQINAIAYTIEEQLAEDIEDCFFATHSQLPDNSVPVAVINREELDAAVKLLSKNHVNSRWILPQIYLCPWSNDSDFLASICEVKEGYLIRTGEHVGLFCQRSVLKQMLKILEQSKTADKNKVIFYSAEESIDFGDSSLVIEQQTSIELLAQPVNTQTSINFKQKDYQTSRQWMGIIRQWKWPLVALVLLTIVSIAGNLILSWQKKMIYEDLISQQKEVLLERMPDIRVTDHPKNQLVKMLADSQNSGGQVGFVDFLHEYSKLKSEFKAVETQKIQYQQLSMAVNLETKDLNSLESFRSRLEQSEFQSEIDNVNISPGKTTGRLVMRVK